MSSADEYDRDTSPCAAANPAGTSRLQSWRPVRRVAELGSFGRLGKHLREGVGVIEDPVYVRWKRQHPRFPGVAKCVELLGRRNVQGSLVDIICGELQANAAAHAAELIAAFRAEGAERVRRILLGIICEAKLHEALPLFVEHLRSEDDSLRYWSEQGLRTLDSPEARRALWEAGRTKRCT